MKYHAEHPTRQTEVPKEDVVPSQRIARGYGFSDLRHAVVMCNEIEQREEDACRLLHAEKAVEWPFAVELDDGFEVRRVAC